MGSCSQLKGGDQSNGTMSSVDDNFQVQCSASEVHMHHVQ